MTILDNTTMKVKIVGERFQGFGVGGFTIDKAYDDSTLLYRIMAAMRFSFCYKEDKGDRVYYEGTSPYFTEGQPDASRVVTPGEYSLIIIDDTVDSGECRVYVTGQG